jgi:hypothetical protein
VTPVGCFIQTSTIAYKSEVRCNPVVSTSAQILDEREQENEDMRIQPLLAINV